MTGPWTTCGHDRRRKVSPLVQRRDQTRHLPRTGGRGGRADGRRQHQRRWEARRAGLRADEEHRVRGSWIWSPDDTMLIGTTDRETYRLADPDTGQVTELDWHELDRSTIHRPGSERRPDPGQGCRPALLAGIPGPRCRPAWRPRSASDPIEPGATATSARVAVPWSTVRARSSVRPPRSTWSAKPLGERIRRSPSYEPDRTSGPQAAPAVAAAGRGRR